MRVWKAYPAEAGDGEPLDALEYVVVDVETTGGAPGRGHRITEVCAVRVDRSGRVRDEVRSLVNPQRPIPRGVTRLTNITNDMVAHAPSFAEVAPHIQRVLAGGVFVAHNAPFDQRFLEAEFQRCDYALSLRRVLCTARLARKVVPEIRHRSLDALQWFFGIENEARHRAYGDAHATSRVLVRLLERAEEQDVWTWPALEELLRRRRKRKKRSSLPTSMEFPEWA